jgi:hypothetical protein
LQKAKEVDDATKRLQQEIVKLSRWCRIQTLEIKLAQKKSDIAIPLCNEYIKEIASLIAVLQPWGIVSTFRQYLYRVFKKNPFSIEQQAALVKVQNISVIFIDALASIRSERSSILESEIQQLLKEQKQQEAEKIASINQIKAEVATATPVLDVLSSIELGAQAMLLQAQQSLNEKFPPAKRKELDKLIKDLGQ